MVTKLNKRSIALIFTLLSVIAIFFTGCGSEERSSIGINALAADPTAFKGEICVKGVVQQVDKENFSLVLIDEEEYKNCGIFPCAGAGMLPLYLPGATKPMGPTPTDYTYKGELPKLEETITAIGTIKAMQDGLLFFEVEQVLKGTKVLVERN